MKKHPLEKLYEFYKRMEADPEKNEVYETNKLLDMLLDGKK